MTKCSALKEIETWQTRTKRHMNIVNEDDEQWTKIGERQSRLTKSQTHT